MSSLQVAAQTGGRPASHVTVNALASALICWMENRAADFASKAVQGCGGGGGGRAPVTSARAAAVHWSVDWGNTHRHRVSRSPGSIGAITDRSMTPGAVWRPEPQRATPLVRSTQSVSGSWK